MIGPSILQWQLLVFPGKAIFMLCQDLEASVGTVVTRRQTLVSLLPGDGVVGRMMWPSPSCMFINLTVKVQPHTELARPDASQQPAQSLSGSLFPVALFQENATRRSEQLLG